VTAYFSVRVEETPWGMSCIGFHSKFFVHSATLSNL